MTDLQSPWLLNHFDTYRKVEFVFALQFLLNMNLTSDMSKYTARGIKHLNYISQFSTDLRHLNENAVAEVLSCKGIQSLEKNSLSQDSISVEQKSDSILPDIINLENFLHLSTT